MCSSQLRSLAMVTPSYLNKVTRSTVPLLTTICGGGFSKIGSNVTSSVFFVLLFIRFFRDHSTSWRAAGCILLADGSTTTSQSVTSSTNFKVSSIVCKSSMSIKKTCGPNHVPCGIPPVRVVYWDTVDPILTRCWRFDRNVCIQFITHGSALNAANFDSAIEWSMWSRA
jgi:hypothetical protein